LNVIDFFRDIFQPGKTYQLNQKIASERIRKLNIENFFTHMAINMIAGTIAKCEFKTYIKGQETKADEYYLWNIEPNDNQNGSQFMQELISKLLYRNEALVVEANGKLLIADSFSYTPYALFPDMFTGVTCRNFRFDKTFLASDVLYFRLGYDDIRLLLSQLMDGYSDILDMAVGKYKRSGGRKGIVKVNRPRTGDAKQKEELDNLFDVEFKKYFNAENAVLPLPNGIEYDEKTGDGSKKSTSEINDIQGITKEAIARVAQAFNMPPALLQGDITDIKTITDNYLTFCIDPLVDMIQTEIIRKRYGKDAFFANTYLKIDTTCIRHIDIFSVAIQADKLIADSIYNVDELRIKLGDAPLNTWWSKKYRITKNYADVESAEGGGTNETDKNNLGGENGSGSA
jgi:HK97 family phage portal protein